MRNYGESIHCQLWMAPGLWRHSWTRIYTSRLKSKQYKQLDWLLRSKVIGSDEHFSSLMQTMLEQRAAAEAKGVKATASRAQLAGANKQQLKSEAAAKRAAETAAAIKRALDSESAARAAQKHQRQALWQQAEAARAAKRAADAEVAANAARQAQAAAILTCAEDASAYWARGGGCQARL